MNFLGFISSETPDGRKMFPSLREQDSPCWCLSP
jgi:hypothetical protein